MVCLITLVLADLQINGISFKGNVIVTVHDTKALISRVNMNKLLNGQALKGAFNRVDGFDLPMFMSLKF